MSCKRCKGYLYYDTGEIVCLNCGRRHYLEAARPAKAWPEYNAGKDSHATERLNRGVCAGEQLRLTS